MPVLLIPTTKIYSLVVITLWGTYKLIYAQRSLPGGNEILQSEDQWTFGQIIPIFLLLGPIVTIMATIFDHISLRRDDHPNGFSFELGSASSHDASRTSNENLAHWNFQPDAAPQPASINASASLLENAILSRKSWDTEEYLECCHVKSYDRAPWLGVCVICECLFLLGVGAFCSLWPIS